MFKMHKIKFLIFLFILIPNLYLYSEEEIPEEVEKKETCKSKKSSSFLFIEVFKLKDLSRDQYEVMINFKDPNDREKYTVWTKDEEKKAKNMSFDINIDDIETRIAEGTIQHLQDKRRVRLQIFSLIQIPEGDHCARILNANGTVFDEFKFTAPHRMDEPSMQPIIKDVHPQGGVAGDTIKISGRNFGTSIDKVSIEFLTKKGENLNYWKEEVLGSTSPYILSKDEIGKEKKEVYETLHFSVPGHPKLNSFSITEWFFGKTVYARVFVNNRPATLERFTILNPNWKITIIIISLLVSFLFIGSLALIIRKKQFIALIVLDTQTNMYSLSKVQAFSWLVALLGSYFYVAICSALILQDGKIPDFNYSLIGLMGISVGGLLTSSYLDNKKEKRKRKTFPKITDLIMNSEGEIELPRLQLLGFTVVSIIIYIFNLLQSNPLAGLPDIPSTLHTLLLTSQGGYIGGKAVNQQENTEPVAKEKKPLKKEKPVKEVEDEDIKEDENSLNEYDLNIEESDEDEIELSDELDLSEEEDFPKSKKRKK